MLKHLLILSAMVALLAGCEAKDAITSVNEMPGKIDSTNKQITKTNDSVHKQTLEVAINGMEDSDNQALLFPVPTKLMPYGKVFAEEATPEEIFLYVKAKLKEISEVNPTNGFDSSGNEIPLTPDQLTKLFISKNGTLEALYIISAYIQDDKLSQMVQDQIVNRGPYQGLMLNILMMRVTFVRDVLLDNDSLEKPMDNARAMADITKNLMQLEYVLELPFVQEVALKVKDGVHSFVDVDDSMASAATMNKTRNEWKKAYNLASSVTQSYAKQSLTGNAQTDEQIYRQEIAAQNQELATMKAYVDKWSAAPKP